MTQRGLDGFIAAITGDTDEAKAIVTTYADVLSRRLGALVAALSPRERDTIGSALRATDRLPGGILSAITWPPVAAHLLGRRTPAPSPTQLAEEMRTGAAAPFAAHPSVVAWAPWLTAQLHAGQIWLPSSAVSTEPGWQWLETTAPPVAAVASAATRAVLAQAAPVKDVTGSWSTDELIGCTVLINPDCRDPRWLADCLLHEAVHHWQAMVEASRPFILDPALVHDGRRYPSPWSGSPLTAKSMIAACFVWFVLADFWWRARSPEMTARAVRGFVDGDPAATVVSFAEALDPDVAPAVARLQDHVRRRHESRVSKSGH